MTTFAWRARDSPLVFESAGRRQLKGFDDPVLVYSVLADSDARKLAGSDAQGERSPCRAPG